MGSLQRSLEALIAERFSTSNLLLTLIESKSREAGLDLSNREKRLLKKKLDKGEYSNIQFRNWKFWERRNLTIEITEQDIESIKKLPQRFSGELPQLFEELTEIGAAETLASIKKGWNRHFSHFLKEREGFEKRLWGTWKEPLTLLHLMMLLSIEVGDYVADNLEDTETSDSPYLRAVLSRLHARSCQVVGEILILLQHGFSDGAMARWRTLHEITVTAFFVSEHGEALAERYLSHDSIETWKAAKQYQDFCQRLGYEQYSNSEMDVFRENYSKAIERFGISFSNSYGWASVALKQKDPKFADIERSVGLEHLRPYYKMASHNVHANPKGILFRLGIIENESLLAGPSNIGLSDPASNTAISLLQVTSTLLELRATLDSIVMLKVMGTLSHELNEALGKINQQPA